MTSRTPRGTGFATKAMHRRREPTALHFLSERTTFWIAALSVIAFVTGNMMAANGWYLFWKSVLGDFDDSGIYYDGPTSPVPEFPNPFEWSKYGGDFHANTFREAPKDVLQPLPIYVPCDQRASNDTLANNIYSVDFRGKYLTGCGNGSHPGIDIRLPVGTPVVSIMNGIIHKVGNDPAGYGNYLIVKYPRVPDPRDPSKNTVLYGVYAHLSATLVAEGDIVKKGQEIGASGESGDATGPHLHLALQYAAKPYWPFTSADAKAAGMTFDQAVNAGLNRDNIFDNATNPLLYVQANYPVVVGSASSTTVVARASTRVSPVRSQTPSLQTFAQQRLALRKARQQHAMLDRSAVVDSVPVVFPLASSTPNSTVVVSPPTPLPVAAGTFSSIEMVVGSTFTPGEWMPLRLVLLDEQGHVVEHPSFTTDLYMRTAYGRATFDPPVLSTFNFKNGVADLRMKGEGNKTVVIVVMPQNMLINKPIRSAMAR
ncbi:M23 family metallopeptidase [Candidatus Peregrinibacteria bacterium]|nr:M23 family metallopeptidase [Candidatus Peregrinibacteria bacterium]